MVGAVGLTSPFCRDPLMPRSVRSAVAHHLVDECRASPDGGHAS
jgi:hypothetical protein